MKKLSFLLYFFTFLTISAQVSYVEVENPVYDFLESMQVSGVIKYYNSFELPKTNTQVAAYLSRINKQKNKLNLVNRQLLEDYLQEFSLEIFNSDEHHNSLLSDLNINSLISNDEKYLYYYSDKNNSRFKVNFIGSLTSVGNYKNANREKLFRGQKANAGIVTFGGTINGSIFNSVGFEISATNGTFAGDKKLASSLDGEKFNYKLNNSSTSNVGSNYFDKTRGYLFYSNDWMSAKIGNDRFLIGNGIFPDLISSNSPNMDYLHFQLRYKSFKYSFYHAKLMGNIISSFDSLSGTSRITIPKNLAYHRFGLNINNFNFGIGEMVVYSDRQIDLSYFNPFLFYKSAEHANQDRDNSMLFFDVENYSLSNLKLYGSILVDDLDFTKFGTSWFGNQTLLNVGFYSTILNDIASLNFGGQFQKVDPYVFTHRLQKNNFTNLSSPIGTELEPNSLGYSFELYWTPHHLVSCNLIFRYIEHGNNVYDNDGKLIQNNGGNINEGHRTIDDANAEFLSGEKDYSRILSFNLTYQPIRNYYLKFIMDYQNNSGAIEKGNYFQYQIILNWKI